MSQLDRWLGLRERAIPFNARCYRDKSAGERATFGPNIARADADGYGPCAVQSGGISL